MAKDIVDVAISQIGYSTGSYNTKYGKWFGMNNNPWCHMFVCWCARQAGVSSSVIPQTAACRTGISWFKNKNRFKKKGSYTPKRGDIVYFMNNMSHVGIVEYTSGSYVHTIEGNTSNKVARRKYSLSNSYITGYGVPNYATKLKKSASSSKSSSKTSSKSKSSSKSTSSNNASSEEIKYLKKFVDSKTTKPSNINADVKATTNVPLCNLTITVNNGSKTFNMPVHDGAQIDLERVGTPGKLTFQALYDNNYKVSEGSAVLVTLNGTKIFYGFVFTRKFSSDMIVTYTVYDQLRYFKNKDTFIYKNRTANQVLSSLCSRFQLKCASLPNTIFKSSAIEDNKTLFDIVQNILDKTLMEKNKMYVLYDNIGSITLKDVANMKVNSCVIDKDTIQDYDYSSSIDNDVYNQVKLIYENKDKGTFDLYVAKHASNINKWGLLQYTEKVNTPDIAKSKSNAYLKIYNKLARSLSVTGALGNVNVRAGSLVPVMLNLQDINITTYLLVEKVSHNFSNNEYTMDLTLSGGVFGV